MSRPDREEPSTASDEAASLSTHLSERGEVRMVPIAEKLPTRRRAVAAATVRMRPETAARLARGDTPKGEVLAAARLAGIMAAKRTPELIPLCHGVALTHVAVDLAVDEPGAAVHVTATAEALDRTGVEMEAMVAASTACLTLYDMLKGIDREMVLGDIRLLEKSGGRSGHFRRQAPSEPAPRAPAPSAPAPSEPAPHEPAPRDPAPRKAVSAASSPAPVERPAGAARIRSEPLRLDELVTEVARPDAGGVATFLGVVRDHNEGRAVTLLEYEAYATMAESELAQILAEISAEVPGVRVAAAHRVGALRVGDAAVACAASAPHRREAFQACRLLIDRIKARLPIWKREHGPGGPYWVGWEDARCGPDGHDHAAHTAHTGHAAHAKEPHTHGPRDHEARGRETK